MSTLASLGLIACAVIILCTTLIIRYLTKMMTRHLGGIAGELSDLHGSFIRGLDQKARSHANTTDDPFAIITLDEITKHYDAVIKFKEVRMAEIKESR